MTTADRLSLRRTASLTRWNAVLLSRNRLALFYAAVMPLLPLGLLFTGARGSASVGAGAIVTTFLVIALFPVYYNVLAQFVSRRDELVLKRMRTGESRDAELLASIALPGAMTALILSAVAIPIAAALGQPLPVNPVLCATLAVLAITMFSAFAYWTAAWTKNAEAVQLTSMPMIILASLGPLTKLDPRHVRPAARPPVAHAGSGDVGPGEDRLVRARRPGRGGGDPDLRRGLGQTAGPLLVMTAWTAWPSCSPGARCAGSRAPEHVSVRRRAPARPRASF